MLKDVKRNTSSSGVALFDKWGPEELALNQKYVVFIFHYCIQSMLHTLNSHVSTGTNSFNKTINMLVMH